MKNQLAFSTLGCPAWSFEKIISEAARMGFAAVEVRGVGKHLATDSLPCFLPGNEHTTRTLLDRYGVRLCVAGTSAAFHDPAQVDVALEEGRRAINVCRQMGIPAIRVFGDRLTEEREATIRSVISALTELCVYAEKQGHVRVLLEIHGDFNTVDSVEPVLHQMEKHPSFGIIWDVEHSFRAYGENFFPLYELIRPRLYHVHIKDCVMQGKEAVVRLPGQGAINLPHIIHRLKKDGYDGWYSFEWEKRWHPDIEEPEIAFAQYVRCMQEWLADE